PGRESVARVADRLGRSVRRTVVTQTFGMTRSHSTPSQRRVRSHPARDRQGSGMLQRGPLRRRLVGVIAAAVLDLALSTASTAQDTATGTVVVPGPGPAATGAVASPALPWPLLDRVQVDLGYTYDDNVTRSRAADGILWDQLLGLDLSAGGALPINDNTRALWTGVLNGEKFFNYDGLSNLSGGLQTELQYRPSAAFDAVT